MKGGVGNAQKLKKLIFVFDAALKSRDRSFTLSPRLSLERHFINRLS
jgi:hypothetical protein